MLFSYKNLHIELSSKCTLKCPRCPRTELHPDALNKELGLPEFKQAFPTKLLQEIDSILFCGDIGDPIYNTDFLSIIEYIKLVSPTRVLITTNGSYKSTEWWRILGSYLTDQDQVTFSVDGWDQASNEQYRVNSDFDSIIAGAKTLRATSTCVMNWSAIYFSFNESQMNSIKALAKDLGFDSFQAVRSSKFDGRYLINGIDPLKPTKVAASSQYEREKTVFTRQPFMITTTRSTHPWARCINWKKELFINVNGLVFPCPWFNSGYQENEFVQKYHDKLNIKTRSLIDILNDPLWQELATSFEVAPLEVCKIKCKNA